MPRETPTTWKSYILMIQTTIPQVLNCWSIQDRKDLLQRKENLVRQRWSYYTHRRRNLATEASRAIIAPSSTDTTGHFGNGDTRESSQARDVSQSWTWIDHARSSLREPPFGDQHVHTSTKSHTYILLVTSFRSLLTLLRCVHGG